MEQEPIDHLNQGPEGEPGEMGYEEPPDERKRSGGTSASTWIAVFGSSTLFHVLLLILLGMIIISQPDDEQEEVTLQIPEEEEEEQEEITRREVEKEVEKETEVTNPTVETTEQVSEVQSEMQAETGQSMDFTSDTSNDSPAERSIALGGGGGGGTYGSRGGEGLSGGGSSAQTQRAVEAALQWLAKHQNEEGYWDPANYVEQCPEGNKCEIADPRHGMDRYDAGVTGLTMLAFLGAGYTHQSDKKLGGVHIGKMMLRSLRWLKQRQKNNGAFSTNSKQMYNHALAAMAYAEAFGMTGDPKLKSIAQKGVDFLDHAQNTSGGKRMAWRYRSNSGENDTSVTGWCAMAMKSAELAGLDTPEDSMQGALRWVEKVSNERGLTGYDKKITSRGQARKHKSMTAVGMLIRMFAHDELDKKQVNMLKNGSRYTVSFAPEWTGDDDSDYYHWYYGSLALFMFAGPDTPFEQLGHWQKWNKPMQKAVLTGQRGPRSGHEVGSWPPVARWTGHGGRVYSTAINALTLEVYYRYDNALFQ